MIACLLSSHPTKLHHSHAQYNRSMWANPRIHLTLETDASVPAELSKVSLPSLLDIIIDDGSHKFLDQEATLHTLWPRLRAGGFYVIEDMLVGALPWSSEHARQVPTRNQDCGVECFFPQRISEHPFMFDRFGHLKGPSARSVTLTQRSKDLLRGHDWFWVVTGVHQGGGLDCSMVIRKSGPSIGSSSLALVQAQAADRAALLGATHQLKLAVRQQSDLQSRHAELTAKLEAAHTEVAAVISGQGAECRSLAHTKDMSVHRGWGVTLLCVLLTLSLCLNAVLLLRRQRHSPSH